MEREPAFRRAVARYVCVRYEDPQGRGRPEVFDRFEVRIIPTMIFLGPDGREIKRIEGYRGWRARVEALLRIGR